MKVVVVGAGLMGSQIAMLCATREHRVSVVDVDREKLASAHRYHTEFVSQLEPNCVAADQALGLITYEDDLAVAAAEAELVIEAVVEDLEVKRQIFADLELLTGPTTILATNSSSLRASQIDGVSELPGRVVNLHFYQPIWEKPMVEIMAGTVRDEDVVERLRKFARSLGLLSIDVLRESTGFVVNRIWHAVKKECLQIVGDGISTVEDVDRGWMLLNRVDIGPFARMDRIGLDVVLAIEETYFRESGLERDRPARMLIEMVARGELGMKTGKGFYGYPDPSYERADFLPSDPIARS